MLDETGVSCKPNLKSFTEKRFPSNHFAIKSRTLECSDGFSSRSFSILHTGALELSQICRLFCSPLSTDNSHPIIYCFKLPSCKSYGGHCVIGNRQRVSSLWWVKQTLFFSLFCVQWCLAVWHDASPCEPSNLNPDVSLLSSVL